MSKRLALSLIAVVAAAASVWVPAGGSQPGDPGHTGPVTREVLVGIDGKGTVTSLPRGISCPKTCVARFPRDILMHLNAKPAPGWRLVGWKGTWCNGKKCAFHLTTPHDCQGQLCSLGVFGTRVRFARLQP